MAALVAPLSATALARAVAKSVEIAALELVAEVVSATDAAERSVASASVKEIEPVLVRKAPVSTAPVVLGLSTTVLLSSVTAPMTLVAVICGASLLPVIVTVTAWVLLALLVPESSLMVIVYVAVTVSPAARY